MFTRRSLGIGGRYLSSVVPQDGTQEDALCALRYATNGWGIQILKNRVIELQPVLKTNGLFCLG
jgi:hypothetical protein